MEPASEVGVFERKRILCLTCSILWFQKIHSPYMQRGGAWDNSDVKGAKKVKWLSSDKEYANGGFKKEQSVSIFGTGAGLDWTGTRGRSGPAENIRGKAIPKPKNYKAPNVKDLVTEDKPKKGLFGMW
jgi:hypothetical protein